MNLNDFKTSFFVTITTFVLVFSVFFSAIIVAALSMSHVKHALRTAPKFALLWI